MLFRVEWTDGDTNHEAVCNIQSAYSLCDALDRCSNTKYWRVEHLLEAQLPWYKEILWSKLKIGAWYK